MHLLIISRSYPNRINRSSGNFVSNQVEVLAQKGHKVGTVGVYNISIRDFIKVKNFKKLGFYIEISKNTSKYTFLYPVIPKFHYINNNIKFLIWKRIVKKYIAKNGKPDIIHLHTFEPGKIAIWIKNKYGIPYITTEHTSDFHTNTFQKWHIPLAKKVYQESTYNIGVSKASCDDLIKRFDSEFHFIPNLVDTSKFKLKPKQIGNIYTFINIAYLHRVKNQDILIKAFHSAFGNDGKYQLKIIGNGEEYKNLQKLINSLHNNHIKLLGYLSEEEIIKHLQQSNSFVLSSMYETFGVVVIEAMSCGLPIVTTKCGGPESIITDEKLGLLCEVNNEQALSEAMKKIVDLQFDGKYIREYAISNFSNEAIVNKLINIYKTIIN